MELLKYTVAVIIGSLLALFGNYVIEDRRLRNEKFKFRLEKMIAVGEEYYKLSTYSLIYFTSMIDTINKREEYMSEGAHSALSIIDEENQKQVDKIKENNITITTASMYFNVTDSEKAVSHMLLLKEATVKLHHTGSTGDIDGYDTALTEFTLAVKSVIDQIKLDQLTITTKIKELLNQNNSK